MEAGVLKKVARVGERVIFHLDMDAFFSSVEQVSNPGLVGKPVIVCGDPYRRSVVSTASYEARKFGLKSGMPVGLARKLCPQGIFVIGNPQKYVFTSIKILQTLKEFTPQVEPFSVDEAFLEFTNLSLDDSVAVARQIKERIRERFSLTCSVGIGLNKYVAKMASGLEKPDGITVIRPDAFLEKFGNQEVKVLWGVGEKTSLKLKLLGISKVRELACFPEKTLSKVFGVYGSYLKMAANGIDDSPLIPYYQGVEPKSVGHEYTLAEDTSNKTYLLSTLLRLSEQVARRMRRDGYLCSTVTIKIRYKDFKTITRQKKLGTHFERDDILYAVSRNLFETNYNGEKVRLLGVSASGLSPRDQGQSEPIYEEDRRHKVFIRVVDSIRDKFGDDSIKRAGSIRIAWPSF
ncbi:MAG: DNA polymerase IV [Candidatus Eisenbacteria bacterium]